jgi:hypothetical protein
MQGNRYPGQFPNQPGPRTGLWFLIILAIALIVGVSVFGIFYFGVFSNSGGVSLTAVPTTGNKTPPPSGPCTANSPYGFTTIHADQQLVGYYKQLNVCWVRYQFHWDKIELKPAVYDWSQVDAAIATMNAANIHVDFAIQSAPQWDLVQKCFGVPYLTGPTQMAQFATILATRYDGKHGHGKIDSFEIGNEEYDQHYTGDPVTSEQCRQASNYGPVLKAGYLAIKAVDPNVTVGMFGQWLRNIDHINTFFTDLFTGGYSPYMDYLNFHFYNGGRDPSQSYGSVPSFNQWWQTIHQIATKYGFANKPIWVTEVGWPTHTTIHPEQPVAPDVQAQYLQYIMDQASQSKVVQKVFWFTINYGNQGDNIYPPGGPLPALNAYQSFVLQKPTWN